MKKKEKERNKNGCKILEMKCSNKILMTQNKLGVL